ncbi:MAG: WYL domain-containing protein [Lentimicrobiaceae bacterium]|nr:WYL domain-containing protein [Lentimicrobiaceae bacterium]
MSQKRKNSKENTSVLFNRYVWLAETIQRAGRITFEEINEKWTRSNLNYSGDDLPLRTFHHHRAAIEEMFDINIACDRGAGYYYYIENQDDIRRGNLRSWMLNAFSVGNLLNESRALKDRILFEKIPSGHQYLSPLLESIRDNLTVEITYQSFGRDEPSTFTIEPYCLKVFKQRWYVLARSPKYDELRIYSLDRIHELEITKLQFNYPADFSPESFFYDSFGVIVNSGEETETVEIKVFDNQRKYFESLPLHHSQTLVEENGDYATFQYTIRPTYDFIQELFMHAENVEVIKPKWLREEFANKVREMSEMYNTKL